MIKRGLGTIHLYTRAADPINGIIMIGDVEVNNFILFNIEDDDRSGNPFQ